MSGHDIIVIGCSAGGVEALIRLTRDLPGDLPAAIFIAHHFPATSVSALPAILSRQGNLPAHHPDDGEAIVKGRIYVARPNYHLLVKDGCVVMAHGPKENGHRPAIDPLFRTAAIAYGPRVIGVLLSGMLDDGTAGMINIKRHGGIAIVQAPDDALFAQMPQSAINNVDIDHILPVPGITAVLVELAGQAVAQQGDQFMSNGHDSSSEKKPDRTEFGTRALETHELNSPPSGFTCPECGGALWVLQNEKLVMFRCHVGHAYSEKNLLAAHEDAVEAALWTALRIMEERVTMTRRMADNARKQGYARSALHFENQASEAENNALTLRQVLVRKVGLPPLEAADAEGEHSNTGRFLMQEYDPNLKGG